MNHVRKFFKGLFVFGAFIFWIISNQSHAMGKSENYRLAKIEDIPAINEIVHHAYRGGSGWTNERKLVGGARTTEIQLNEIISKSEDQTVILVLLEDEKVVGSVCLENRGSYAHLGMLAVDPQSQGKGLGKKLIESAEHWLSTHWNCKEIQIEVISQRIELVEWYSRRGFISTGETKKFSDVAPDASVLVPNLSMSVMTKRL